MKNLIGTVLRLFKLLLVFFKSIFLEVKYKVSSKLINTKPYILFIKHNRGGGTEQYLKNYINDNPDKHILVLSNFSYYFDFFYWIEDLSEEKKYSIKNFSEIFTHYPNISKICINSLVGFQKWKQIQNIIIEYKQLNTNIELKYLFHDFHCICPGINLIWNNTYCDLKCLKEKTNCHFNRRRATSYKNINYWQNSWQRFLSFCDKLTAFSDSTKELVCRVYPEFENKIEVHPHTMSFCNYKPISTQKNELRIGIIGGIHEIQKGELIVKEFQLYCKTQKIKVFIYDSYEHDKLPSLLENDGINSIFFPSICPETFSYVVSEVILMDLPIVCFNLGAQEEKVKKYKKGKVISLNSNMEKIADACKEVYNYRLYDN